jgi:hypothetical protein
MFVEMEVFTRRAIDLGLEDGLGTLQDRLRRDPRAGDVDPGTCGLRKIRMMDAAHAVVHECTTSTIRSGRSST